MFWNAAVWNLRRRNTSVLELAALELGCCGTELLRNWAAAELGCCGTLIDVELVGWNPAVANILLLLAEKLLLRTCGLLTS